MTRRFLTVAAGLLVASTAACLDDIAGPRAVSITVSADVSTLAIGQTVTISFAAEGTGLAQVTIDFGDGDTDIKTYAGPVRATDFSTHEYTLAGTYVVVAEVVAAQGSATDSVTITVN